MVIVNIFGGLGNQMFQYALGRNLAYKLKTTLKFNYTVNLTRTDFDPNDITSIFDILNVKDAKASKQEIEKFILPYSKNYLIKSIQYIKKKLTYVFKEQYNIIYGTDFGFNKNILLNSHHCYLSGYWQSEKYFIDIENLIREEFSIKIPMSENNLGIARNIESSESVSIHLRGRDYIKKEATAKIHLTCDKEYYDRSITLIKERINNPIFFVFSDDPEWAKTFLKIDGQFTFIEGNSWNKTNYEDLRLMSLCKHNIIANSSFSWWGAWLNKNSNKIIIAPKKWYNDLEMNDQTNDLVPEKWIRL